jgi:hypothetical protein
MSNLSDIGFPTPDEQAVNEMIMHVLESAQPVQNPRGFYLRYADPSGAEIYLQGSFEQELIGFNPHFAGASRRRVGLVRAIERDSSPLDGGFYAWANPTTEDVEQSGEYPFVFDAPDFRAIEEKEFPRLAEIQLTAFASNDFQIFDAGDDYQRAQESDFQYASKMFVPVGLFDFSKENWDEENPPRPVGKMAGEIKEFALKTNEMSGERFYHFLIDTHGGEADVVVDPKYVTREPRAGGIVSGTFWLSGRVLS